MHEMENNHMDASASTPASTEQGEVLAVMEGYRSLQVIGHFPPHMRPYCLATGLAHDPPITQALSAGTRSCQSVMPPGIPCLSCIGIHTAHPTGTLRKLHVTSECAYTGYIYLLHVTFRCA